MYVVAGVTGRVGSVAAERLLGAGAPVRALVRHARAAQAWSQRATETAVLDLRDRPSLAAALSGAEGFFVLLPFDLAADDIGANSRQLIAAIAGAVHDSRVPHVTMLSSGGADLSAGTGPIADLHTLERALAETGTVLSAIRPSHFQEKVAGLIEVGRSSGIYPVFADSADIPVPMVATADIGELIARTLLSRPRISEAVDVIGPAYTERQVGELLAEALGRTLEVVTLPRPAWTPALIEAGTPAKAAELLVELYDADQRGLLAPRGDRTEHGPTELRSTIIELVGAAA